MNRVQEEIKCLLEKTKEEERRYERIHKEIENIEKHIELIEGVESDDKIMTESDEKSPMIEIAV